MAVGRTRSSMARELRHLHRLGGNGGEQSGRRWASRMVAVQAVASPPPGCDELHRSPRHLRRAAQEGEGAVGVGPSYCERSNPPLFGGRRGVFLVITKRRGAYWGAVGAVKLVHLP
jgi:hypothetical protein